MRWRRVTEVRGTVAHGGGTGGCVKRRKAKGKKRKWTGAGGAVIRVLIRGVPLVRLYLRAIEAGVASSCLFPRCVPSDNYICTIESEVIAEVGRDEKSDRKRRVPKELDVDVEARARHMREAID
ncbi:hypothetical protein NL676_005677 [Syzygium grande]|nr:hypothetical protein NL676_005677 [Syzygium grande]